MLAPRERARGALSEHYEIPRVELRTYRALWLTMLAGAMTIVILARHVLLLWIRSPDSVAMVAGILIAAFMTGQWALSLCYKPTSLTPSEQARVDRLRVAVIMPCYNEDPAVLDRSLYSLVNQSRPPERVSVVERWVHR